MKRILSLLLLLLGATAVQAENWSHWRGPEQNGVSRDRDLPDKFSIDPKAENNNLIWTAPYGGRSTPIIQNGRVYLINNAGSGLTEQERVMCFDEKTGERLKEFRFNVFFTDIVSVRLGWTTPVGDPETGNVYVHGTQGLLFCFDKDLNVLWQHSMTEEYGRISGYGGRVTSPIVDGDLVILGMLNASWGYQGRGMTRFVAFDKKTGKVVWWASTGFLPKDTFYSTPVVANIAGQRLLVSGGGDGCVHAFKIRTGEKVWSYHFGTAAVNCSPVVGGSRVYIGHGEDNDGESVQGRIVCVDGSQVKDGKPKLIWKVDGIKVKFASPVLAEGRLYVCDDIGNLYCLDAENGKQIWVYQYGKNTQGSPVLADGKIYIPEVDSRFHILQPGADGCKELHSQFFRNRKSGVDVELNGSPAVANGRVYFMTSTALYCIGKKDHKADTTRTAVTEPPLAQGGPPAHLQVVPADVVLHPGESVVLTARVFNKYGQNIGKVEVKSWELAGMLPPLGVPPPPPGSPRPAAPPKLHGEFSDKKDNTAKLTVDAMRPLQFGRVVAKAGSPTAPLTAEVRVRVVPRLPFSANFSKVPVGRTPAGWVNCQGKFAMIALKDGHKVLKKTALNASPLVARANAYMGLPTMKDYTVEADVMGDKLGENMPDAGIVASRYTLFLSGNKQTLRLVSWDAVPRVDKTIDYAWKPGTWYRLKLTVVYQGSQGIAKGKVWERGQPEPKDWTVEFTDPIPNREGSPALYGYATGIPGNGKPGTEAFYDNVKITPNK